MTSIQFIKLKLAQGHFSEDDFNILKADLYHLPIIPLQLSPTFIFRSRENNDAALFESLKQLSYPPIEKSRTDRASLQGKPMFYACTYLSEVNQITPDVISVLESIDWLDDYESNKISFFTQVVWKNQRSLRLLSLPSSNQWKQPCEMISLLQNFWTKEQFNKYKDFYSIEQIALAEYLGNLMSEKKNSCLYDITAHSIDYLLNESVWRGDFDGIAFPSTKSDGSIYNICLKPEVVNQTLEFKLAYIIKLIKQGKEIIQFPIADSLLINDKFLWKPIEFSKKHS